MNEGRKDGRKKEKYLEFSEVYSLESFSTVTSVKQPLGGVVCPDNYCCEAVNFLTIDCTLYNVLKKERKENIAAKMWGVTESLRNLIPQNPLLNECSQVMSRQSDYVRPWLGVGVFASSAQDLYFLFAGLPFELSNTSC